MWTVRVERLRGRIPLGRAAGLAVDAFGEGLCTGAGQFRERRRASGDGHEQRFGRAFDSGPVAGTPADVCGDQVQSAGTAAGVKSGCGASEVESDCQSLVGDVARLVEGASSACC